MNDKTGIAPKLITIFFIIAWLAFLAQTATGRANQTPTTPECVNCTLQIHNV